MTTGYIFGDTGGHADALFAALESLGVNLKTGEVPEDVHIVHVGDLIHRGLRDAPLVGLLSRVQRVNPDRWTQILGNHEALHVDLADFEWRCACSPHMVGVLNSLLGDGKIALAAAFAGTSRHLAPLETVVTHAGLTHTLWKDITGSSTSAAQVAMRINDPKNLTGVSRGGEMLGEGRQKRAGVFWAAATSEVYPDWLSRTEAGGVMPFNQIHGHNAPFSWEQNCWYPGTPLRFRKAISAYGEERAAVLRTLSVDGMVSGSFVACDPGFGVRSPRVSVQPYVKIDDFSLL